MMGRYRVQISGAERSVEVERLADGRLRARIAGLNGWFEASPDGALVLDSVGRAFRAEAVELGGRWVVQVGEATCAATLLAEDRRRNLARRPGPSSPDGPQDVHAPMPGRVVRVGVKAGDPVSAGQALVVVEAMKMENEIRSNGAGTVRDVAVHEGQLVETGERLLTLLGL